MGSHDYSGATGFMKSGFEVEISTLKHSKSDLNSSFFEFLATINFNLNSRTQK